MDELLEEFKGIRSDFRLREALWRVLVLILALIIIVGGVHVLTRVRWIEREMDRGKKVIILSVDPKTAKEIQNLVNRLEAGDASDE